jgi:CDP-diglyceride synthetase
MYIGNEYHATVLLTVTLLAVMIAQLRRRQVTEAMASISGTFFGVFYVGWLLSHVIPLRFFTERIVEDEGALAASELGLVPQTGAFLLVFCLSVVVLCDTGAYFAGRAYGKRKLAPSISPGKSWEGVYSGMAGVFVLTLAWRALEANFNTDSSSLFGQLLAQLGLLGGLTALAFLAGMSVVGDLVESLVKRAAGAKDSSRLLPGHGGVLDRVDALLPVFPLALALLSL